MKGGALAEFSTAEALLVAARALRERGYVELDAFTPYPVPGLQATLGLRRSQINWVVFPIAMGAALLAILVQWLCNGWAYPLNVGGRPNFALPAFVPIAFETGVLVTGFTALVALFWICRFPALWHPVFDAPGFERASVDRFWLGLDWGDPRFDQTTIAAELRGLGALSVAMIGERS